MVDPRKRPALSATQTYYKFDRNILPFRAGWQAGQQLMRDRGKLDNAAPLYTSRWALKGAIADTS